MAEVTPKGMIGAIVLIFLISILGSAFTVPLQDQVTSWKSNLTAEGQTTAASVVGLIPMLFWVLLAVGIIIVIVEMFVGGVGSLAVLPLVGLNLSLLMFAVPALCLFALAVVVLRSKNLAFARQEFVG